MNFQVLEGAHRFLQFGHAKPLAPCQIRGLQIAGVIFILRLAVGIGGSRCGGAGGLQGGGQL